MPSETEMTELEWRQAERRDPDKTYVEPEHNGRRMIAAAWACFMLMPVALVAPLAVVVDASPALATHDGESYGTHGTYDKDIPGGPGIDWSKEYNRLGGASQNREGQQDEANVEGNQGMTGGDAYFLVPGPIFEMQDVDAVNSATLFEPLRAGLPEDVPVAQMPPRYYWYFPRVRVYDSLGDVIDALGF